MRGRRPKSLDTATGYSPLESGGTFGDPPEVYERDTVVAEELARQQADKGRFAVWRCIEVSGHVVVAAVFLNTELAELATHSGKEVVDMVPGQTVTIPVEWLLSHPTCSVSQRDLWALNAAIRIADSLDQQTSEE